MESGILSDVLLPIAIILIIVAMGMSLTVADFELLQSEPRAIPVGLGWEGGAVTGLYGLWMLISGFAFSFAVAGKRTTFEPVNS